MRLLQLQLSGYRSVRDEITIHIDRNVTVLLGANDHGKTNVLESLLHLNHEATFQPDDLNWDREGQEAAFPRAEFVISLNTDERKTLFELWTEEHLASVAQEEPSQGKSLKQARPVFSSVPDLIVGVRQGVSRALEWQPTKEQLLDKTLPKFMTDHLPRVELINPVERLVDSIEESQATTDQNEFMQGIFYTAGIPPQTSGRLFVQNDRTDMELTRASERLSEALHREWGQGRDARLRFRLAHSEGKIQLQIHDPAVESTFVRPSRRSSGFTQFFNLSMVLHARKMKHSAESFIWLFDEPGLYLHPTGQHDLLQTLESLSRTAQSVYTTHSLFMINRNFPSRHQLLRKGNGGTESDTKPFASRWRAAIESLGLALPGSILFAPHVLITEGDSDSIYLNAMLQFLVENQFIDIDLNGFAAISSGDSPQARALIELLTIGSGKTHIGLLFDGDEGGKERERQLKPTIENAGVSVKRLSNNTAIEDHLPLLGDLFPQAVATYNHKLGRDKGLEGSTLESIIPAIRQSFSGEFPDPAQTVNVAQWASEVGHSVNNSLPRNPSKSGIAREYSGLLGDRRVGSKPTKEQIQRALQLAREIKKTISIPSQISNMESAGVITGE